MTPLPISATIICQDEAEHIGACIESLAGVAEIVVVDSGSADATLEIVRGLAKKGAPIRLFERPWPGYAAQKQFALDRAAQPWCLNIDADEVLDPALRGGLAALTAAPDSVSGWRIRRRLTLAGHGPAHRAARMKPVLRLVRRARARYPQDVLVHESLEVTGDVRAAPHGHILDRRALAWPRQAQKERAYAMLKARQLHARGAGPRYARLIAAPAAWFLRRYVAERYALCGRAGFVHALAGALYAYETERALIALNKAQALPQASSTRR